ncbi:hypothetical protein MCSV2_30190 [Mucispirillum schaedleri ASF457]|nr:hypothetical protein MCSV2_30190 [Mucispirillum schaedleri ASF457]
MNKKINFFKKLLDKHFGKEYKLFPLNKAICWCSSNGRAADL